MKWLISNRPLIAAGLIGLSVLCINAFPAQAQQLSNLTNQNPAARFTLTDRVWAANPGDASICLWADDKLAAISFTVDDNNGSNIDWWLQVSQQYGFKVTWFVITGWVGDGNPLHGTWEQYNNVQSLGHDVQSHSVTHSNSELQYAESIIDINENMTSHHCEFLAYPGGTVEAVGTPNRTNAALYYAAARSTTALINQANKIDYLSVNATSTYNITNPAVSWSYLPSLFTTNDMRYFRGWSVLVHHRVDDPNTMTPMFEFYAGHQADLWGGTFGDIAKYGQERDTASLTVTTNTSDRITMTLSDQMLDSRFNYPLTIKVRLPATWSSAATTQNGAPVDTSITNYNGANYALVKAVPDRGEIALTAEPAVFTAVPRTGWAPLSVSFADTSANGTTNRLWDFGDGTSANTAGAVIEHTYISTGTYTVQLIQSGINGVQTNTQANCIVVTAPVAPSASFSASPASGSIPLPVIFTDTSTGDITNRFWNFGDGGVTNTTATGVVHTYTSAGTNTVRLVVSGFAGASTNTQAGAVIATAPVPPTAGFTLSPASGTAPLSVSFTDTSTGDITGRFWDFGDGATTNTTQTSLTHTYTLAGTNTVILIVSGSAGVSTNRQVNAVSITTSFAGSGITATNARSTASPTYYANQAINGNGTNGTSLYSLSPGTLLKVGGGTPNLEAVFVFQLPTLPSGQTISNANLAITGMRSYATWNVDLYAIRSSASASTVLTSDYSAYGDSGSGTKIFNNMFNTSDSSSYVQKSTDDAADLALANWLKDQYASVGAGGYVFFRLQCDNAANVNSGNAYNFSGAANTTYAIPELTITLASPSGPGGNSGAASISQYGITWTFDSDRQTGQYANGDYWVVGPVNITSITNNLRTAALDVGTNQVDGSMINPVGGSWHGYDSRLPGYSNSLNKALSNGNIVSITNPLLLPVNSSLISSVSWTTNEPGCPAIDGATHQPRPLIRSMAVLTCVSNAPPAGTFRPAYCGSDKSPRFNKSQLDYSKLANLNPVSNTPALLMVETNFSGPWVDHVTTWSGDSIHPQMHMPNYGRDMSIQVGQAALMLQLDFSQLPGSPGKEKLLIGFTQMGIDLAGVADTGGNWSADGGIFQGRKFPILFAGTVLNDTHMKSVGNWATKFQEDMDTFYVSQAEVDITHSSSWTPDNRNVTNNTALPYETAHIGLPEWGIRHENTPEMDNLHWMAVYRVINNQSYPGWVLATHIMGLRTAWNHEPLFDYIDRSTSISEGFHLGSVASQKDVYIFGNSFIRAMWKTCRADYPPRWIPVNPDENYGQGTMINGIFKDNDGDGLPDEWETQYFGGSTSASPAAPAANGINTAYECYVAGLNPTNARSVFVLSAQQAAPQMKLEWSAVSGRVYNVYWTTNLLNGFQPLETNIVWPQNSWTDTVHGTQVDGFYRLKVGLSQ